MSLRWRIALGLAAIAALVSLGGAYGAYATTSSQLRSGIDSTLRSRIAQLNARPEDNQNKPEVVIRENDGEKRGTVARRLIPANCPPVGSLQPANTAQIISPNGVTISCLEEGVEIPITDIDRLVASGLLKDSLTTRTIDNEEFRVLTSRWNRGGAVQISRSLEEAEHVLDRLKLRLSILSGGAILSAAFLGWLVATIIVRPLQRLRMAAEQIATTQDLSTPLPDVGTGEVKSLSASLKTMVSTIHSSREQQQRLITDASHEMRTPLTSIKTNIEMLLRADDLSLDQRKEIFKEIDSETTELSALTAELVELATDGSPNDEVPQSARLSELAANVVQKSERRSGRDITLTIEEPQNDQQLRVHQIERAISNLVNNAVKYSPDGAPIEVRVSNDGRRLDVRDHGAGISAEDQPHVFERFYRATSARAASGSGLGLSIVAQIVALHHGTVWAASHPDGGALVGFELPNIDVKG